MGWTKQDIEIVPDLWDLFDIITENARQEQSQKYNIGEGSPQPSRDKTPSEMTIEEKRDLIKRGRVWLEKAQTNSLQK